MIPHLISEASDQLRELQSQGLLRQPVTIEAIDGPIVQLKGRSLVCWCSNDYLGLSLHPAIASAAAEAAKRWGVGARASRLLGGTTAWHARLEEALAAWFGADAAVVFPSGYLANLGILSALATPGDLILIDRLAHASLVDAARATRARLRVFAHNNVDEVARLLARTAYGRRRFVVTEGVFSMEGDCAPLAELLKAAQAHGAIVYLDDAHGAFVLGAQGRGTPEACGIDHGHGGFLSMGTLGKALGCQGGFLIGPTPLINVIRNRARTFIYTTALATPVAAAAVEALAVLKRQPQHRQQLQERAALLHQRLGDLVVSRTASHIVPIVLGSTERALEVSQRLWQRGHWAPAIRPPTVPRGTARLRLSVTALHTEEQIEDLSAALKAACA